ncbi:uncharacterized protein [Hyperolius riggenbachi]|uniref:uncharacterized protein n=1 Tax=Hyperolius riggenbachi TaxID=752182 RepID=UPI0035A3776A
MSLQTRINGFTAWMNVRLLEVNGRVNNALCDLFQGTSMKLLLESFTGKPLKRFESLDGLTQQQIVTRVEWFVEEIKRHDVLPPSVQIDCRSFASQNREHVLDLLWKLISYDLLFTWELSSQLMHSDDKVVCSIPYKWTPVPRPSRKKQPESKSVSSLLSRLDALSNKECLQAPPERKTSPDRIDWNPFPGRELAQNFNKDIPKGGWANYPRPEQCALQMIHAFLKDAKAEIRRIEDLVHCRVLCSLVNYFLPQTFAAEVLLDDRWTVNVALKTLEELLFIRTSFSCDDLLQGDLQAVCAYVCFISMAGLKYKQTRSVVNYAKQLSFKIEVAKSRLKIFSSHKLELNQLAEKNELQQKVIEMRNELQWLKKMYDLEKCQKWVKHARKVQRKTKDILLQKMKDRFEIIVVPRPLTICDLCSTLGINLQLTQGSGFCHVWEKQTLPSDCRIVLYKKDTQHFLEDFSGSQTKVNIRKLLNLPVRDVTELSPELYTDYKIFRESKSRNRVLKANSLILYQVFPGNPFQWLRILHQAVNENEYCVTANLLSFFKEACPHLINSEEMSSGCVALHLASQNGFFDTALLLLENGASVNKTDRNNHTPFYYALAGKHRDVCKLLIEWGYRIDDHNTNRSMISGNLSGDLKDFYKGYSDMWQTSVHEVLEEKNETLRKLIEDHEKGRRVMASLRSRCIDGSTLLHTASYFGEHQHVETLLQLEVDIDVLDYKGATPLQRSRDVKTIQLLLAYGAQVNWRDDDGNTALHMISNGEPGKPTRVDCLQLLLSNGASTRKCNNKGLLPVHCAALQGQKYAIQVILESDPGEREFIHGNVKTKGTPSLPYLALANGHLDCAKWLITNELPLKGGENIELLFDIVCRNGEKKTYLETVDFLLSTGIALNICDNKGNSVLHFAALYAENYEILKLLLSHGADVNLQNCDSITPLFNAVFTSNFHGASLLIDSGANLKHQDNEGLTAFDHIKNIDDWIESGIFSNDINEVLRAYELRQCVQLVKWVDYKMKMKIAEH